MKHLIFAVALAAMIPGAAHADDAMLGQVMWSAFTCSEYASLHQATAEASRRFQVGYDAGKKCVNGLRAGTIKMAEANQNTLIGVTMVMAGPTADVGRVFELSTGEAYVDVVKKDGNRTLLDEKDWVNDPNLEGATAINKFTSWNCK